MLFKNIVGQTQVKEFLSSVASGGKPGHAYLFLEKVSAGALQLAVAFANQLNCHQPAGDDGCGSCSSCYKVSKLIHPDLHFAFPIVRPPDSELKCDDFIAKWREMVSTNPYFTVSQWFEHISGERKSGIIYSDESQEIIRKLSLKNFEGRYKVMIIWQPELLNTTGANKLLKVLEEPPPNTVFILVSGNTEGIPVTLLSRVQQVTIPPVDEVSLSNALAYRYSMPANEAGRLARLSRGDYAKAIQLHELSKENSFHFDLFTSFMRTIYIRNFHAILKWTDETATLSRDKLKSFFDYSTALLRETYIYNFNQPDIIYLSAVEEEFVMKFAPFINDENIHQMVEEFKLAHAHVDQNGNARLILFDLAIKLVGKFNS